MVWYVLADVVRKNQGRSATLSAKRTVSCIEGKRSSHPFARSPRVSLVPAQLLELLSQRTFDLLPRL